MSVEAPGDLASLAGRLTCTVPEAGQLLGIGRDAAYAAVERGELPCLRLGRRLIVPVPRLLDLLGAADIQSPPHDPPMPGEVGRRDVGGGDPDVLAVHDMVEQSEREGLLAGAQGWPTC